MSNRLLVAALLAVVIGSSAAWSQDEAPMRQGCGEDPLTPGACFIEFDGFLGTFVFVDDDGDAFQGWTESDITDFIIQKPNGTWQLHWQGQSEYVGGFSGLLACRAGDFPACAFPPFPGLLAGSGNLLIAGEVVMPGIGVRPPFVIQATGLVADVNTGQEFDLGVNFVLSAAGAVVVRDINIRVAN